MKFSNASGCPAGWTLGFQRDGRELLVAIVKATYSLPRGDGREAPLELAPEQQPLVLADEFVGAPGLSAPRRETDYAHAKPGCDVLLLGHAHAPQGRMVKRLQVGLRVGSLVKRFAVVGERHWGKALGIVRAGEPTPFMLMPVGYERAFGGTDPSDPGAAFRPNPAGRGWRRGTHDIDGLPLPNTEEVDHAVTQHDGDYRPMALSPLGRHWLPRQQHAGTYDAHWLQERAPFWPDDFDERYFQAAPPDQVMPHPRGGEEVVLQNLSEDGLCSFRLPQRRMPVTFIPQQGHDVTREALLDTIVLEPDEGRVSLTWRAGIALGRSVFDVRETVVGEMSRGWYRARRFPGKTWYRSLDDAVKARRGGRPS